MAGLKSLKTFPFKSMLVILGVFLMIAVVLLLNEVEFNILKKQKSRISQSGRSGYGTDGCEITAEDLSGTS